MCNDPSRNRAQAGLRTPSRSVVASLGLSATPTRVKRKFGCAESANVTLHSPCWLHDSEISRRVIGGRRTSYPFSLLVRLGAGARRSSARFARGGNRLL